VYLQAKSLKEKCNYHGTIPYWDWTQDVQDLSTAPVFSGDTATGFGGNGDGSQNNLVTDGAFTNVSFAYPYPHTVRRNFNLFPNVNDTSTPATAEATPEHIREVLEDSITGNYTDFSLRAARNWPSSHDGVSDTRPN
jgi:tyrosinase